MGFKASEVEELTYDFTPHGPAGTIPEPTSAMVEHFRSVVFGEIKGLAESLGVDLSKGLNGTVSLDQFDTLMQASAEVEQATVDAVADLTGIANSTLNALPYRIKAAFIGWIVGQFVNPEA